MYKLSEIVEAAARLGVYGLSFQHVTLCPTRTWLHYHRIDCAHLNHYMQNGIFLHQTSYGGKLDYISSFGIQPDQVDWLNRTVSEVKRSRFSDESSEMQLLFYMAVLADATGESWGGLLKLTNTRRIKRIEWDDSCTERISRAWSQIQHIINQSKPPAKQEKPICQGCSYRLLCWGISTEDDG